MLLNPNGLYDYYNSRCLKKSVVTKTRFVQLTNTYCDT